jgi:uncharacterized repeat protein (TIGR04052 family)
LAIALLSLASLASCEPWDLGVEVQFVPTWNGQALSCEGSSPALTDLRFFVSAPRIIDEDGRARVVRFATEFEWQNDAAALIDLESGRGDCASGTPQVHDRLMLVARAHRYRGLRFTIGVPFRLNHANPLMAGPPLDDPDMYWHWRSGYKFMRAGIRTADDGFWIHSGSAGCEGTAGHITGCRFPNRIDVFLPDFVPGENVVEVDLAVLLAGTDLDDAIATNCSSQPPETACFAPFDALGIDFATGQRSGPQRVFSAR